MRLFAIAIVAAVICLPAVGNQQQTPADKKDGGVANQPNQASPVTVVISQPNTQTEQARPCEQPRKGPPIYSNWVLAAVAGIAAFAGFLNLGQIKRQAKATEDAANGALLTAKAAINAERAWLRPWVETTDGSQAPCTYNLKATNDGKTPARIIGYDLGPLFVPNNHAGYAPPKVFNFTRINVWINGRDIETVVGGFNMMKLIADTPGGDRPGEKLLLHGQIEYVAMIESDPLQPHAKVHTTTFFCEFQSNGIVRNRPEFSHYT